MERVYSAVLARHMSHYDQMALVSGPRQVGKTTVIRQCQGLSEYSKYLNWDRLPDRTQILEGVEKVVTGLPIQALLPNKPILALDEIHKYRLWRTFLKGLIDEYKGALHILVTGSAKLNLFRRGGDSLMGRYFNYRIHPLSVGELLNPHYPESLYRMPQSIPADLWENLFRFGGFPEPFVKQEEAFHRLWQKLREEQTLREDIRDLAHVRELQPLETLAYLLKHQVGQLVEYSSLSKKNQASDQSIRRWMNLLEAFFYCFCIKPWSSNVTRSLLKQPKVYLWDWSVVEDPGARIENFVASHLLKSTEFWTDQGKGTFELFFLRDKDQREVDFLITQNKKPWILLEVKKSAQASLSPHLLHFQKQINPEYIFQLAFDMPYVDKDCFAYPRQPLIVSLKTFLSQLI